MMTGAQSMVADPKQLVRSVAQSSSWQVTEAGDQWQIIVPVGPLRKQKVNVQFDAKDAEGNAMLAFSSVCGPASGQNAMELLKYNTQMVHGAFAIESSPAGRCHRDPRQSINRHRRSTGHYASDYRRRLAGRSSGRKTARQR